MPFAVVSSGDTHKVVNTATGRTRSKHTSLEKAEADMNAFNAVEREKEHFAAIDREKAALREEARKEAAEALKKIMEQNAKPKAAK